LHCLLQVLFLVRGSASRFLCSNSGSGVDLKVASNVSKGNDSEREKRAELPRDLTKHDLALDNLDYGDDLPGDSVGCSKHVGIFLDITSDSNLDETSNDDNGLNRRPESQPISGIDPVAEVRNGSIVENGDIGKTTTLLWELNTQVNVLTARP
jgi:hypothetical protein